jgi:endogenous inhibitor of DNA gyrase (YacG/DUF329 family)
MGRYIDTPSAALYPFQCSRLVVCCATPWSSVHISLVVTLAARGSLSMPILTNGRRAGGSPSVGAERAGSETKGSKRITSARGLSMRSSSKMSDQLRDSQIRGCCSRRCKDITLGSAVAGALTEPSDPRQNRAPASRCNPWLGKRAPKGRVLEVRANPRGSGPPVPEGGRTR